MSAKKAAKKAPAVHSHTGSGSSNSQAKPPIKEFIQSPNHSSRNGSVIEMIVMHCTEASLQSTIATFKDGSPNGRQVSAHYVIDRNGDIYQMVSDSDRANHCKGSNRNSIGIEHVASMTQPLTPAQSNATAVLVRWLTEQYDIPLLRIYGHDFTPGYSGGGTSCPDALFGAHSQAAVQAWVAENVAVPLAAVGVGGTPFVAAGIGLTALAFGKPSEAEILKVVCQELEVLASFKPTLTDSKGNPTASAPSTDIAELFKDIAKQDKNKPAPLERLAVFIRNLKGRLSAKHLPLEPTELVRGDFMTVSDLVFHILTHL